MKMKVPIYSSEGFPTCFWFLYKKADDRASNFFGTPSRFCPENVANFADVRVLGADERPGTKAELSTHFHAKCVERCRVLVNVNAFLVEKFNLLLKSRQEVSSKHS